jgi:hypothetical protein
MQYPVGIDQQGAGFLCKPDHLDSQAGPDQSAPHHQQRDATDRTIDIRCRDHRAEPSCGVSQRWHRADDTACAP